MPAISCNKKIGAGETASVIAGAIKVLFWRMSARDSATFTEGKLNLGRSRTDSYSARMGAET